METVKSGEVFEQQWKVVREIATRMYSRVFEVESVGTKERFAMKVIPIIMAEDDDIDDDPVAAPQQRLEVDVNVMRALKKAGFKNHCSFVIGGVNEAAQICYKISTLGGLDLVELQRSLPTRRFTLRSVVHLAERILNAIREVHRIGYVHRDVKPRNFVIGYGSDTQGVYMVGAGLARSWVRHVVEGTDYESVDPEQRTPRAEIGFRGSIEYASLSAHRQRELGRVDDLWSWFFMLIEFTVGKLPWSDVLQENIDEDQLERVEEIKERVLEEEPALLVDGCPHEYRRMFDVLKPIKYFDKINYDAFFNVLRAISKRKSYDASIPMDWEPGSKLLNSFKNTSKSALKKKTGS